MMTTTNDERNPAPRRRPWAHAVLALALAGCDSGEQPAAAESTPREHETEVSLPEPATTAYAAVPDGDIVLAVEGELRLDNAVPEGIRVESRYGIVTLEGTVETPIAAKRAVRIAESVRGVKVVDDDLVVVPPKVEDQVLRRDIAQALLDDPAADRYELDIDVEDGQVTLRGTVESYVERMHSQRVAEGVRGVRSVDNEVVIGYETVRSDSEMEADVQARLRWDALIDDRLVDAEVDQGRVSLTGTVGSAAERRRALNDAWVLGVRDVDGEGLGVEPWADREHLRDTDVPLISDQAVAAAITTAAMYDPYLLSFQIMPEVSDGVVTLRGSVDNALAKAVAEEIASETVGVISVDNQITVKTAAEQESEALESRIRAALVRNAITESFEIGVEVKDGRATLRGTVDSLAELAEASQVALGIRGVWSVDNRLTVERPLPFVRDPYLRPYHPYGTAWSWYGTYPVIESDDEIAQEVRDELFWSPFVDEDQVVVTVDAGKATLTGTVDSWVEYRAATDNAFEGGAVAVDNDLTVSFDE